MGKKHCNYATDSVCYLLSYPISYVYYFFTWMYKQWMTQLMQYLQTSAKPELYDNCQHESTYREILLN